LSGARGPAVNRKGARTRSELIWLTERIAEAANLIHCRLAALPLITNDYRLQTVQYKRRYEGR
jgi:hypothetical protein